MDASVTCQNSQDSRSKSRELTLNRVKLLALRREDIAHAAATLGRGYDLVALLASRPDLRAAWSRGQTLRALRELAAVGATIEDAAGHVGLSPAEIRTDVELASTWNAGRLELVVTVNRANIQQRMQGNGRGLTELENDLRREISRAGVDVHHAGEAVVCEIVGVTRQSLNGWVRGRGCPRNQDGTFDLPAVWRWYAKFLERRHRDRVTDDGQAEDTRDEWIDMAFRIRRADLAAGISFCPEAVSAPAGARAALSRSGRPPASDSHNSDSGTLERSADVD
jgi:hypothetical protein